MACPGRKSFLIRIDPKLWAELEGWAQQELRSVNGQIEYLLRDAVTRRRKATQAQSDEAGSSEDGSGSAVGGET